jgi:transcriptional regulator with XRE-family HTH domain
MSDESAPPGMSFAPAMDAPATAKVDEHIGGQVRKRRRMLGLTQEELATRVGVTAQQVHKYESGANRIAASKLFEIATALNLPISAFFEGLPAPPLQVAEGAAEDRLKSRLMLDKDFLELAMRFDEIEETPLRKVVMRIIRAATEEPHKKPE